MLDRAVDVSAKVINFLLITTGRKALMAFHAARQKAEESEEKELSLEDINREMNEARKGKK